MRSAPLLLLLLASLGSLPAAQVRFGAMGDSTTDEYLGYGPSFYGSDTGMNWVQVLTERRDLLSATPEVDFGPSGSWGFFSPQWLGYEHNYAVAGATTASLLTDGQPQNVLSHAPDVVYLGIGFNDVWGQYGSIYLGADAQPLVDQVVANITTAVEAVLGPVAAPTGVRLVLGNVENPDIVPELPLLYPDPAKRALVTAAVQDINAQLAALAQARGLAVVDLYALTQHYPVQNPLVVGGVTILPGGGATDDPQYFYLPDEFHYGTVFSGLIANAVLCAANTAYCTNLTPLSDAELLDVAGLQDPGLDPPTYVDLAPFVQAFGAPCATWLDLGSALAGSAGEPVLAGAGVPMPLKPITLTLSGALAQAPAGLVAGLSVELTPLFGGVLVPAADLLVATTTDAQGSAAVNAAWPLGTPAGVGLTFQFAVLDPGAPQAVSLSNAVQITVP
ncbi:MAG: SGNH/GDSL hydrolase family protein [Planctomycetota bacterium]